MASGNIKGITIEFKGDTTQLGKALTSVNKEIRATDSALREVDKALKLDPSNVDLLAQKEALLAKQIEQTKDKLELQEQAAQAAAQALEEGTISQEEYAKLTAEVSTTASKLQELEGKASDTSAQLKDTGNAAQEAGEKASSSSVNWSAWASAVGAAAEVAWEAIKAVGEVIADVTSAMVDMSVEAANYADDMLTMSTTTGVAVDTLQALQYGEDLLDTSIGTVSGSITKLIKAMGNAQGAEQDWQDQVDELNEALANGTMTSEDYAEAISDLGTSGTAFSELGINILDAQGNLRDSEEVFWEVIDALGEIENVSERDTVAMDLFGRSAMQLNSLIEAGSEGFREIYSEAEAAGAIMDGDALDAFHNFDDTLSRLDQGTQAARRAIGSILLPVLDELAGEGVTLLNDFTNGILDANGDIDQMGVVIENAVNTINEILQGDLVNNIIELGGSIILTLATALLDNLDSILSAGITLIMTVAQGIVDNLSSLAPVAADLVLNLVNFVIQNLPTVIDAAVQIIVAIVDGISRALPELIPAAVACVEQVITALIDNLDLLIPAALELILALAMGIVAAIPQLVAVIPQLVESIANEIVDLADSLADAAMTWGVDLIQGFIDGIWNSMGSLVSSLESVASTIAEYLGFSVPEKGPLHEWAYNNPGSDMIDLFTEGMENEDIALQRALYGTSNVIYNGMSSPDYSGALSGISSQLAGLGGGGGSVINVYLGSQRVGSVVTNALDTEYYLQGGT